jgi:hypothetical protein
VSPTDGLAARMRSLMTRSSSAIVAKEMDVREECLFCSTYTVARGPGEQPWPRWWWRTGSQRGGEDS